MKKLRKYIVFFLFCCSLTLTQVPSPVYADGTEIQQESSAASDEKGIISSEAADSTASPEISSPEDSSSQAASEDIGSADPSTENASPEVSSPEEEDDSSLSSLTDPSSEGSAAADENELPAEEGEEVTAFPAPVITSCTANYTVITVAWDSVSDAEGYILYRWTGRSEPEIVATITDPTVLYVRDSVPSVGTWHYRLQAYRTEGGEQILSEAAETQFRVKSSNLLSVPSLKIAYTLGYNTTLTWKKTADASGYYIYRRLKKGSWELIRTITSPNTVTFKDTVSTAGTYYYTIRSYRAVDGFTLTSRYAVSVKSLITGWDIQTNYGDVPYVTASGTPAGATIKSGGCGPTSVGNVLRNYIGLSEATTTTVAALAISSNARKSSGTDIKPLLAAAQKRWGGFTYKLTTSASEMRAWVASGKIAIGLAHSKRNLLTTGGHYVTIQSISGDTVTIFDSAYWDTKWTEYPSRISEVTTTKERGRIKLSYSKSMDVFVRYYLIDKTS